MCPMRTGRASLAKRLSAGELAPGGPQLCRRCDGNTNGRQTVDTVLKREASACLEWPTTPARNTGEARTWTHGLVNGLEFEWLLFQLEQVFGRPLGNVFIASSARQTPRLAPVLVT
ncbi:hypothetical protein EVAR_71309_1 [Eumeta japonica]|uniref:Uncharacterized protein n=1 Tax=Eumeta variegata TaxID=151549 RepID=A0A4C2AEK8_EUMVA|nr:hypothetical protein EVAR_71309_1 [Eumeta japonica]